MKNPIFSHLLLLKEGVWHLEMVKSGIIVGIDKIGESLFHLIDNVYLVNGLQHSMLSVSQLCDKDNLVVFSSKQCLVVNINTGDVVLRGK